MKINTHALCTIDSISDGRQWRMGTGFVFLRKDWVVTAKHVIFDDRTQQLRDPIYLVTTDPLVDRGPVQVSKYFLHPDIDLAIIEATRPVCNTPLYPAHQKLSDNEHLVAIGYSPNSSDFASINFTAVTLREVDNQVRQRDSGNEEIFEFDFKGSEQGNSGGPIFGDGAGVLAVIGHGVVEEGSGICRVRATSIQTVIDSLNLSLDWSDLS